MFLGNEMCIQKLENVLLVVFPPTTCRIVYTKTHKSGLCDVTKDPDTASGLFCWSARYNRCLGFVDTQA